uniref:hypothetical protein n=1 Tax=Rhodospora sordida TaxID=362230 RepID=UPI001FCD806A|nr:hypothetical protein MW557_pgp148 [Rhodospora sordida]UNJ14946.1 hypothetical protein [Rhodospora sordida]
MEIILLGEKFFTPHYSRQISSVAVRLDNSNEACLFDCGESTQHYLIRSCLKNRHIKRIIISELNSDACLGIIGLLATFSLNERLVPLEIYGPEGFCKYLRLFSRYSQTNFSYQIKIFSVKMGVICQFSGYKIIAFPLTQYPFIFGYSIVEQEKAGKFRIYQAHRLKIPSGPIYGLLKQKTRFILSNGFILDGEDFCELPTRGRKFTYITRFSYEKNLVELAWKSDMLLINNRKILSNRNNIDYYLTQKIFKESHIQYLINLNFCLYKWNSKVLILFYRSQQKNLCKKYLDLTHIFAFKIKTNYRLDKITNFNS